MIDLFGCSEPTPMGPGWPIVVTMSSSRKPGTNLLGLSTSCTISHIPLALQPIGDLYFLFATYQGLLYKTYYEKGFTHRLTRELAQLFVDILKLHVFQETSGSGRGMHVFSSCVVK